MISPTDTAACRKRFVRRSKPQSARLSAYSLMKVELPKSLLQAINNGIWKNPGAEKLRSILGDKLDDLELFNDISTMERLAQHLDEAGYVDNQTFCMVRGANTSSSANDRRLVFERALILGGSVIPGDDVFLAVHLNREDADPELLVFDWEMPVPNRWVARGTLQGLIDRLARLR